MATLKNSFNNISNDTESIVRDYVKLFSIRQSERLAKFLGILFSAFALSILLLIVFIFCAFALAEYINVLLASTYWGYLITAGIFLLVIVLLIIRMLSSKKPLLNNWFIKFIVGLFDIEIEEKVNVEGLEKEKTNIQHNIAVNKVKVGSDIQMLRYVFVESFFREFMGMFSKDKKTDEESNMNPKNDKEEQNTDA